MSSPGGGAGPGPGQQQHSTSESFSGPPVLSEEQLLRLSKEELVARLKSREGECVRLMKDRAQLMKDVNRTLQVSESEADWGKVRKNSRKFRFIIFPYCKKDCEAFSM